MGLCYSVNVKDMNNNVFDNELFKNEVEITNLEQKCDNVAQDLLGLMPSPVVVRI